MRLFVSLIVLLLIEFVHSQLRFDGLCLPTADVDGMPSTNGDDEFEIDLYESKFLPDDTVFVALKQKRQNYGIKEFALRAFHAGDTVVGRFDDRQVPNKLALKFHTCSNEATVVYVDKAEGKGYHEIPLAWRAVGLHENVDEVIFKADIVSNRQVYHVESRPLKRRLGANSPYYGQNSIDIDRCGESQGCLIVPQQCNNNARCEYALTWEVLDKDTARFRIAARAHGFVGVGFSNDEKRGDDQVVICRKDAQDHVFVQNMFVSVQTPQYILRERPSYGLQNTDGYWNGTHIVCEFDRKLAPYPDTVLDENGQPITTRDEKERGKFVDLRAPHYMYPIYSDQDLFTPQGMRIPPQDIPIVNNHPVNFERRIWAKSHPHAGALLAKIHGILNIIAWVLFASSGLLIARHFQTIWPKYDRRTVVDGNGVAIGEEKQRRQCSFLTLHAPIMVTVAILTWVAFFAILFELNWKWTEGRHHMWHSILGLIVLVLAFLNPFIGVLRPVQRTKRYCCWYWFHWLIGSVAHCLAIPVIFLGMDNRRLDLWNWCSWVLFGWCIFHFIVQLIFEIHACCYGRHDYQRFEDTEYYPEKHQDHRVRPETVPGVSWKPGLLIFYVFVTSIVVTVLVLAIIFYQGY